MLKLRTACLPSSCLNQDSLDRSMQRKAKVINVDFSRTPNQPAGAGLKGEVNTALDALNSTAREILVDMFGLRDGNVRSIYEVSHRSGLDTDKVQELSNRALRQLFFPRGASRKSK